MRPRLGPAALLDQWRRLSRLPGGKWIFSRLLGRVARYTGSIRPRVERLEPGRSLVRLEDRPAVRNHLRSIHAIALANLAEAASGLALLAGVAPGIRAILVGFEIEYLKKARGPLVAEGSASEISDPAPRDVLAEAIVRDAAGEVVARAQARWRIGLERERAA
jgi:acyl-coenzyme A thioesterase PaaI-like protein